MPMTSSYEALENQVDWLFKREMERADKEERRDTNLQTLGKHPNYDMADRDYMMVDVAANRDAPDYLRLAYYCYANMDWNGHCPIDSKELMQFLNVKDVRNLRRSVKTAIKYGLLADGSDIKCLKAPRYIATKSPSAKRDSCKYRNMH